MPRGISSAEAQADLRRAGLEPLAPYPGRTNQPWPCRCLTCGTQVSPRLGNIRSGQGGCQRCAITAKGVARRVPDSEALADMRKQGLRPLEPFPGSQKPWKSQCLLCGNTVTPRLNHVRTRGGGCRYCAGNVRVASEAAAAEMQNSGLEPLEPYPGANEPWKCRCLTCGKEVTPSRSGIRRGRGCRHCAGNVRVEPDVAVAEMLAARLEPLELYPGSNEPWRCRCLICDKEVAPRLATVRIGNGCRFCAGNVQIAHATAAAEMQNVGLEPLEPYPGANQPWKCRCLNCGTEVSPRRSGVRRGRGCLRCGGTAPVDPNVAADDMRQAGLHPLGKYKNLLTRWPCRCLKCGEVVTPTLSNIRRGQGGCRFCSDSGFDFKSPAVLYVITHRKLGAHKIGIAGEGARINRLSTHRRHGWTVYKVIRFTKGADAHYAEQAILKHLRTKLHLAQYLSSSCMPQRGETETVDAGEISLAELWQIAKDVTQTASH